MNDAAIAAPPTPVAARPPLDAFQRRVLAICALIVAIDGFDTAVMGFLAPAIRAEWNVGAAGLTAVMMAGLAGLLTGSFLFGPLADRIGRRVVILGTCVLFGTMSLASGFSSSLEMLVALRFLTGLGLGGAMPNAITLCSEYTPDGRRAGLVALMMCGFTIGMASSGFVSSALLPAGGWRSVLILGGVAPLVLVAAIWRLLPESARFLAARETVIVATDADAPPVRLLAPGMRGSTLLLWLAAFASMLIIYLIGNWMPLILTEAGYDRAQAALLTTGFHVGGTLGGVGLGRLMDRWDENRVLGIAYLLAVGFIVTVAVGAQSLAPVALGILGVGVCVSGGQVGLQALASGVYPAPVRATGVSWMNGVGRAGSIVGSVAGGAAIGIGLGAAGIFAMLAVPAAVGGGALLWMGRLRRARGR